MEEREKTDYEQLEENLSQMIQNKDQISIDDLDEIYRQKGRVTDCDFGNILGNELEKRRINRKFWELAGQLEEIVKTREEMPYIEEVWKQASSGEQAYIKSLILKHKKFGGPKDKIEEEIHYFYNINLYIEIWKKAIKNKDKKYLIALYDVAWAVEYWKMKGCKLEQLEGSQLQIGYMKKHLEDDELKYIDESRISNTRNKYKALMKAIGLNPKDLKMLDGSVYKYFIPRGTETLIFSILANTTPASLKKLFEVKALTKKGLMENVKVIKDIIDTMDKLGVGMSYQKIIKAELNYRTYKYIGENHNNFLKEIESVIKNIISLRTGKNIDLIGPRIIEFYYEYLIGEARHYMSVLNDIELKIRRHNKAFEKQVISRIKIDQAEEIKEKEYLELLKDIMVCSYSKEIKVKGRLENKLYEYIKNKRF